MSVGLIRRRHRVGRYRRARTSGPLLTQRVIAPLGRGVHVPYADRVAAEIDRVAWARVVTELVARNGGNKTTFAAAVGVDRKTVTRWTQGNVAVSEENVRRVARAVGEPVANLLLEVGLYQAQDLASRVDATDAAIAVEDRAIRQVRESNLPLADKQRIIDLLLRRRREHEEQRMAEAAELIGLMQPRRGQPERRDVG